jgi:mono/diheme cytochrome c family protein
MNTTPSPSDPSPEAASTRCQSSRFRAGLISGLFIMLALVVIIPLVIGASGFVNVSAQGSWGPLDPMLGYASRRSISFHASSQLNPHANDPQAITDALPHYKEMCVVCHAAPGMARGEIAEGLNPPAPDLAGPTIQKMTDGQLFWVIANGVRSTGMPAFEDADDTDTRWEIVSFVRHLPHLTPAELDQLHEQDEGNPKHQDESQHPAKATEVPNAYKRE